MDIKSPEKRSLNMSRIKGKNTKPEVYVRSLLHKSGLRYRVNFKDVIGKPDIYFSKHKVAVFIHGCYWHRHVGCKYAYTPKSNTEFWFAKLESNIKRDKKVISELASQDIRTLVIWECTVKKMQKSPEREKEILKMVQDYILTGTIAYWEL